MSLCFPFLNLLQRIGPTSSRELGRPLFKTQETHRFVEWDRGRKCFVKGSSTSIFSSGGMARTQSPLVLHSSNQKYLVDYFSS